MSAPPREAMRTDFGERAVARDRAVRRRARAQVAGRSAPRRRPPHRRSRGPHRLPRRDAAADLRSTRQPDDGREQRAGAVRHPARLLPLRRPRRRGARRPRAPAARAARDRRRPAASRCSSTTASTASGFFLNRSYFGLYIPRLVWRELDNFSSGSVCLVIASRPYEEDDYFRSYEEFMAAARGRQAA